jgi:sugar lactone lactonase YvrE
MHARFAMIAAAASLVLAALGCASDDHAEIETVARVKQKTIDARTADAVYGQPDFTTSVVQPPDHGVNAPRGLAIDPDSASPGRVWIADTSNHRTFAVDASALSSRFDDSLFGQPSWTDVMPNGGATPSESHVDGPTALTHAFDQWLLADTNNHRVLFGAVAGFFATGVLGQGGSFTTNVPNKGGLGPESLLSPAGVTFFGGSGGFGFRYVVSDSGNHRVVVYASPGALTATWVIGQSDFTVGLPNRGVGISNEGLNDPRGITRATPYDLSQVPDPRIQGVYVVDRGNNRVLHFPWTVSFEGGDTPGPNADAVWGQSDFSTGDPGVGADHFNAPTGIAIDPNNGFWLADTGNHRVLHFPYGSKAADKVIGQPDFDHADPPSATSESTLDAPEGVAVAPNGDLYVADTGANRILKYSFGIGDSCDDGDPCTDDTIGALGCIHTITTDSKDCFPYECDVGQRKCVTDCRTFAKCQAPFLCIGGRCLKACSPGSTCEVGYCSDGICCDAPCTGTCEACTVPGFEGKCVAFSGSPATFKSTARCESPTGDVECAGFCDGVHRDACQPMAKGTRCGASYCKEGVAARGGACDGAGSCVADAHTCFPFACGAAECRTECSGNDQCADGAACESGVCVASSGAYVPVGGSCVASRASFLSIVSADRWAMAAVAALLIAARRRKRRAP